MRATAEITGEIPDELQVGDEFQVVGIARVIAVQEDLVDVTRLDQEPGTSVIAGARSAKLLLTIRRAS